MSATFLCPRCSLHLERVRGPNGFAWTCPDCGGHGVSVGVLRKSASSEAVREIWESARAQESRHGVACPVCTKQMAVYKVDEEDEDSLELDVCPTCSFVWLDDGELDALSEAEDVPDSSGEAEDELSPLTREVLARYEVEAIAQRQQYREDLDRAGDRLWWWSEGWWIYRLWRWILTRLFFR